MRENVRYSATGIPPFALRRSLTRFVPKGVGADPLMAGAGTGLLGEWTAIAWLRRSGSTRQSRRRCAIARGQEHLFRPAMSAPWANAALRRHDRFGPLGFCRCLHRWPCRGEGLDNWVRITGRRHCDPTIKHTLLAGRSGKRVQELVDDGRCVCRPKRHRRYVSMPNRPDTVPSRAVHFENGFERGPFAAWKTAPSDLFSGRSYKSDSSSP